MLVNHIYNFNKTHPSTEGENSVNPKLVLDILVNAVNANPQVNKHALETIQRWEKDAVPGFLASLKEIVAHKQIPDDIRLCATILAKNTVGNTYRKTVDTREWIRISEDEKHHLRDSLIPLLLHEENEKIVKQIVLLIANIARFDFPHKWATLLDDLLKIIASEASHVIYNRYKAAMAFSEIIIALNTKITVSEGLSISSVKMAVEEAKQVPIIIASLFPRISSELHRNIGAFQLGDSYYPFYGKIANFLLISEYSALKIISSLKSIANIHSVYENLFLYSNSIFQLLTNSIQVHLSNFPYDYLKCQSNLFFKIVNLIKISLEKHPFQFTDFLIPFVKHYTSIFISISSLNSNGHFAQYSSQLFPPNKIMKITQFLTKILCTPNLLEKFWQKSNDLQNFSESTWKFLPVFTSSSFDAKDEGDDKRVQEISKEISQFFASSDNMSPLICAILSQYMSLTREELENWENDPEAFIKDIEAQDTPRQSSEEFLVALSIYNPAIVEEIVTMYMDQLKLLPPSSFTTLNQNILNLDACYKSIALTSFVVPKMKERSAIQDINQWYFSDLKNRIENTNFALFPEKLLLFRTLWIIRKLGFKLEDANRIDFLKSPGLLRCLYSNDIVISLQTIITIHTLLIAHKEYSLFRNLLLEDDRRKNKNEEEIATFSDKFPTFKPTYLPTTQNFPIGDYINGSFILLPKLTEIESRLKILSLIMNLINIIGRDEIISYMPIILKNIPILWESLSTPYSKESGSEIILKRELVILISNIVNIISDSLFDIPSLFDISITTLKQAIDFDLLLTANVSPPLYQPVTAEEGISLWISLIRNSPTMPQPLFDLLFILLKMIRFNIEPITCLQLLEAYILLGGSSLMSAYAIQINELINFIIVDPQSEKGQIIHSLYCLDTILRLFPVEGTSLFRETIQILSYSLNGLYFLLLL